MWKLLACSANITSSTKMVRWPESSLHKNKIILCVCVQQALQRNRHRYMIWLTEKRMYKLHVLRPSHKAQALKVSARLLEDFAVRLVLRPYVDYDLKSTIIWILECWWHHLIKCTFRVIRLRDNSTFLEGVNKFILSFLYLFTDLGEIVYISS